MLMVWAKFHEDYKPKVCSVTVDAVVGGVLDKRALEKLSYYLNCKTFRTCP